MSSVQARTTHRLNIVLEQHVTQVCAALVALNVQLSLEIKSEEIYDPACFPFPSYASARIPRSLAVPVNSSDPEVSARFEDPGSCRFPSDFPDARGTLCHAESNGHLNQRTRDPPALYSRDDSRGHEQPPRIISIVTL